MNCWCREREGKREMAITIFRPSITHTYTLSHSFFSPNFTKRGSIAKTRTFICSVQTSSDINSLKPEVSFCVGTHLIPHPQKVEKGGEDAFCVSSFNGGVIAVADGVSGWAEKDVNPALFPQELMGYASCFVEDEEVNYDPQILLRKAHAATSSKGSATVIVAMLDRNGTLKIANVGDCGLKVIRKGQIIFSSSPQEHYFDCPYQLSSEEISQTYLDATVSTVELMEGDFVVMGSDGLFDNVFDQEIVSTMARYSDVVEAAKALANLAHNHSMDSNFDSPYILEARTRGYEVPLWKKIVGLKLTGGKLDDITVIVGQVVRAETFGSLESGWT